MELDLASKRSLELDAVRASAMRGSSLFHGPADRTPEVAFRLARIKRG